MKFTYAQILLLASTTSAQDLFLDDFETDLTEDIELSMDRWSEKKLDRYYSEKIEDVSRDFERDVQNWARQRLREERESKNHHDDSKSEAKHLEQLRGGRGSRYAGEATAEPAMAEPARGRSSGRTTTSRSTRTYRPVTVDGKYYGDKSAYGYDREDRDYVSYNRAMSMAQEEYVNKLTSDLYGWTIEDKIKSMNIRERYMPVVEEIMKSKEIHDFKDFAMAAYKDPKLRSKLHHLKLEAEWAVMDIAGGCNEFGCQRPMPTEEIRVRADEEKTRNMSRRDRYRSERSGVIIDNDDIYDRAEDIEHLWGEVQDFMNPKNEMMQKAIKADASVRFSAPVQKLISMFMKDLGIKSKKDLGDAIEKLAMRVESDIESCPYFRRMRLAVERMVRFFCDSIQIKDLPWYKSQRQNQWVDDLTKKIYNSMRRPNGVYDMVPGVEKLIGEAIEGTFNEIGEYMQTVENIEQTFNKNKAAWI